MREETFNALKKYEDSWVKTLDPATVSIVRTSMELSKGPLSFSELQEKTGLSSRTLNKWLKKCIRGGIISKERQKTFPWKTTLTLNEEATLVKLMGSFIKKKDERFHLLIERAGENYMSVIEIVEESQKLRNEWLDIFFRMDPSWLENPFFLYVQIFFSAVNSITFWGTFFALNFPHIKEKAQKIMQEEGLSSPMDKGIIKKTLK